MPDRQKASAKRGAIGRIDPASMYTAQGCQRYAGMGPSVLRQARQAGLLHPIYFASLAYYSGQELIDLIKKRGKRQPQNPRGNQGPQRPQDHEDAREGMPAANGAGMGMDSAGQA